MARRLWSWGPAVAWTALTFYVSHQPVVSIPFGAPDYVAHAVNYAVLGALLIWGLTNSHWTDTTIVHTVQAIALAILLGIGDEFHQSFVPGRDTSVADLLADAVGASAAACAISVLAALRRHQTRAS